MSVFSKDGGVYNGSYNFMQEPMDHGLYCQNAIRVITNPRIRPNTHYKEQRRKKEREKQIVSRTDLESKRFADFMPNIKL